MQFSIDADWTRKFDDLVAQLGPDDVALAMARALNRACVSAVAATDHLVAQDMKLSVGDVKSQLQIVEARPYVGVEAHMLEARIVPSRKALPLEKFGASGPLPSRGRGRVTANTGTGRKTYEGAFRARLASGHVGVFKRVGESTKKSRGAWSKNLPIKQLYGPSIAWVFKNYQAQGMAAGQESLHKNLLAELRFRARDNR